MSIERYGILNDIHFPYEDKSRYKTILKVFKSQGIHRLYLNGDIGEFLAVSAHPKHPSDRLPFSKEVEYCNERFDELQKLFPDIPVTYICGNHEYRFFRYIRDLAPQMWGLIDCPELFRFDKRPYWRFVDYTPDQLVKCGSSKLYLRHEPLGGGVNSAKMTCEQAYVDIGFGHTHTYQVCSHRKVGPKPITTKAYSLGWLGDKSRPVFDYRGGKDRWVMGGTLVECDTTTGEYTLDFINLDTLPVFYRGKWFNAK